MQVHLTAIQSLCSCEEATFNPGALREAITKSTGFDFSRSPLRYLRAGLEKAGSLSVDMQIVFSILGNHAATVSRTESYREA